MNPKHQLPLTTRHHALPDLLRAWDQRIHEKASPRALVPPPRAFGSGRVS